MTRSDDLARRISRKEAERERTLDRLFTQEKQLRKLRGSLSRSLSAQARGVRPPSPKAREQRAQDEGEKRARREARAGARPPPGAPGGVERARAKLAAQGGAAALPRRGRRS